MGARSGQRASERASQRAGAGLAGEQAAARFLVRQKHRVLERNLRLAGGEIDLVTLDRASRTLCIVEVKARVVDRAVQTPEAQFGPNKQRQVAKLTHALLAQPSVQRARDAFRGVRIDLVAVDLERRTGVGAVVLGPFRTVGLRHYPNAVTGG